MRCCFPWAYPLAAAQVVPIKVQREFAPPAAAAHNATSQQFCAWVGDAAHAWDARTGRYVSRHRYGAGREVSAACFDLPRARRAFLGTERGEILTVNYVTGEVMGTTQPHAGEVGGLAFCPLTRCVISRGADGTLRVFRDDRSHLAPLRCVENAHRGAAITCMAYSPRLSCIASGDAEGWVALWDFQMLQQHARLLGAGAASTVVLLDPHPILVAGDATGALIAWRLSFPEPGYLLADALCRLASAGVATVTGLAFIRASAGDNACPSDVVAAATDTGGLCVWLLKDLPEALPVPEDRCPPFTPAFKPYRRVDRDMRKCEAASQVRRPNDAEQAPFTTPRVTVSAHDEAVLRVVGVDKPCVLYTTAGDGVQRLWRPLDLRPVGCFDLPNRPVDRGLSVMPCEWNYFVRAPPACSPADEALATRLLAEDPGGPAPSLRQRFQRAVKKVLAIRAFGGALVEIEDDRTEADVTREWERLQSERSVEHRARAAQRARTRTDIDRRRRRREAREATDAEEVRRLRSGAARANALGQLGAEYRVPVDTVSAPRRAVDDFACAAARAAEVGLPAFSERSITGGLKAGLFDAEAFRQLRAVARFSERRSAYGRRICVGTPGGLLDHGCPASTPTPLVALQPETSLPIVDMAALPRPAIAGHNHKQTNSDRHVAKMAAAMGSCDRDCARNPAKTERTSLYVARGSLRSDRKNLSLAELVKPHYTVPDVERFRESFNFVDVDLSGMINMEEWFMFLGRMNQRLSSIEAQMLFLHIDKDRDGEITMRELLSIVFQKASRRQLDGLCRHLWDQHLASAEARKKRDLERLVRHKLQV